MGNRELPDELAIVAVDAIDPCPIQPRVNVSVDLVNRLAASMKAGRHEPVIEVEPEVGQADRYQILCGEQRWRAAAAAGIDRVLVRIHPRLRYLERLEKQYEENRLRADLDPVEEAHCILLDKTIRDISVAEQRLRDGLVPFQPLDDKQIASRSEFGDHLGALRRLLAKHKVDSAVLSPWAETEKALAISESQRKAKVGILRLPEEAQEAVRSLPAEHAIQLSRLVDDERQAELVELAPELTHREVKDAVERLRADRDLAVSDALTPTRARKADVDDELAVLADLCRQLLRLLDGLRIHPDVHAAAVAALRDLRGAIDEFEEAA